MQENTASNLAAHNTGKKERQCPQCDTTIPVYPGYVTWCDECGWNLKPADEVEPQNLYEKLNLKLGARLGEHLFRKMLVEKSLAPRLTFSRVLAYIMAGVVHSITVVFLALGVWGILAGWPNVLWVVLGVLSLGVAVVARPRLGKRPKSVLDREEFPVLYDIADQVADALGAKRVDGILWSTDFNASFMQSGLRRRSYLIIGIPLFAMHTDQEKIALLGHELGHSINGDVARGMVVGSAIDALAEWYDLVCPESLLSSESGMPGLVMLPMNAALYCLAGCMWLWMRVLTQLLYRDSQRAEYLADYLSAVIGGDKAGISSHRVLYLGHLFEYCVQRVANNPGGRGLFDELRYQMEILPERELERVDRISRMQGTRTDTTHPATPYRIEFLRARHKGEPKVRISPEDSERLEHELEPLYQASEKSILEEYRYYIS